METESQKNILVIDNDEELLRAITTRLESHGYHCMTACDGEEGLKAYSQCQIDLVITDLNMAALDGIGFVEQVRRISTVPIILVTGYTQEYWHKIREIANVVVLAKPFEGEALMDLVKVELAQQPVRLAG